MLMNIVGFLHEIFVEIAAEIQADPGRLMAELVQFAVLAAIVWVVAVGFGKRKGFVANMLLERGKRVAVRLEGASHAEQYLAESRQSATATTRAARAKARAVVASTKKECAELEASTRAEADAECLRIHERAESALATEQIEMVLELREQLVDLVSSATRSIMNEKLTIAEQRALIESGIVGSMSASSSSDAHRASLAAQPVSRGA